MREIFRAIREHNSDALHEELTGVFGDRFQSVNTGPYHGRHEFMFVVSDDFTERDEQRLDDVLTAHDSKRLTHNQQRQVKASNSAAWLRDGFNVQAIYDDIARGDQSGAISKLTQFVEAVSDILLN